MTNGLLIRGSQVQSLPSPPNNNGSLSVGVTPHSVSANPSKTAENQSEGQKRSHSCVTDGVVRVRGWHGARVAVPVERIPSRPAPPPPPPAAQRTLVEEIIERFAATIRVRRAELLDLRVKLTAQVEAIDAALGTAPLPAWTQTRPRPAGRSVANSSVLRALREGRLTAMQAARKACVKTTSATSILSLAVREGLVVREGWGKRAHYRLADMGDG